MAKSRLTRDTVKNFAAQFFYNTPDESSIWRAWRRLLRPPSDDPTESTHPKHFVLAILYMLHLEQFLKLKTSSGDVKAQDTISDKRLIILTRFDLWIRCHCSPSCGKEWNFVNRIGMYKPQSEQTPPCKAVWALKGRLVPRGVQKGKSYNLFHRKEHDQNILEDLYKEWKTRD